MNNLQFTINDPDKIIDLLVSELYAGDPWVSLREAIQNARDANHAFEELPAGRRAKMSDDNYEPFIAVWFDGRDYWVGDNGIGMDLGKIQNALLNIGNSDKEQSHKNLAIAPVISKKGFIGKYGIGVLAYFILAKNVHFYTRHFEASSTEWIHLTCAIDENKDVPSTEVSWEEVKNFFPMNYPISGKKAEDAHGTLVRFELRMMTEGDKNFQNRLQRMRDMNEVRNLIKKNCFFLDQKLFFWQGNRYSKEQLFIVEVSENYGDDNFLKEIREMLDGDMPSNKPLYSKYFKEKDFRDVHIFLFLRNNQSERHGLDVYVDRMLAEKNAHGLKPGWADFIHGVVVLEEMATSLDRRSLNQSNIQFIVLQECLEKICLDFFKEFIQEKKETFLSQLWPTLQGTLIPSALRAYDTDDRKRKEESRNFFKKVGLGLPVPVIRGIRGNRKKLSTRYEILNDIMDKLRKNSEADEKGIVTIKYLENIGSAEMAIRSGIVIHAVKYVEDAVSHHWTRFLGVIGELHKEFVRFEAWKDEDDFIEESPPHAGWISVLDVAKQLMKYGDGEEEKYEIACRSFDPPELPLVILEKEFDQDRSMIWLKQIIPQILDKMGESDPLIGEMRTLIEKKLKEGITRFAFFNIKNIFLEELADDINECGKAESYHAALLRHVIEDARIDNYGGRHIGREVLSGIYRDLRIPAWQHLLNIFKEFRQLNRQKEDITKCLDQIEEKNATEPVKKGKHEVERFIKSVEKLKDGFYKYSIQI